MKLNEERTSVLLSKVLSVINDDEKWIEKYGLQAPWYVIYKMLNDNLDKLIERSLNENL